MPKVLNVIETPNPLARRFLLDTPIVAKGSVSFPNVETAQADKTAARLFEIPDVTSVFYLAQAVTVNIDPEGHWENCITPIADILEETLVSADSEVGSASLPPLDLESPPFVAIEDFFSWPQNRQLAHLEILLDAEVRPGLASDGGGLELLGLEAHVVKVHYEGACGSCPSSQSGTLRYVEGVLQRLAHPDLMVVVE